MAPEPDTPGARDAWYRRNRRETLDLAALGLSLLLANGLVAPVPAPAALCAAAAALLVPLRPASTHPTPWSEFLQALPRRLMAVLAAAAALRYWTGGPMACLWFAPAWPVAAWLIARDWAGARRRAAAVWARLRALRGAALGAAARVRALPPALPEALRCALLGAAALWLMRGFAARTLKGTGDARWYATMLADMVAQVRSGVFPVWCGQSLYQFNGAIYPLRVAPAFHYMGALLDVLTLHALGVFALQNLLLILLAVAAIATAYLGLRALLPGRAWTAALLAALFLSCPGVLGISYNTDLFMSWTTLPMVPVVWFATVRSFQDGGAARTLVLLGASLGCCWWGHSPIALWSTLIAGTAQAVRIAAQGRGGISWRAMLAAGVAFGAIAAYPVGSVLLFPPEPGVRIDSFTRATAGSIAYFLREVFPATILPLSRNGRSLGDFQLGYALWAVLLVFTPSSVRAKRLASAVPLAAAALLCLLLLPIPGLDLALWTAVPGFVRDTTGNWAMNRLYLPVAAATVFGTAACVAGGPAGKSGRSLALGILLATGCAWSFSEASKFATGSRESTFPPESAIDFLRPENVQITQFSYMVFPATPSTFSHGVTDPALENHLLARDTLAQIAADAPAAATSGHLEAEGDFSWKTAGRLDYLDLDAVFTIRPSRAYLLDFDFPKPSEVRGELEIAGSHFFRVYGLPEHGGAKAFGAGGEHSRFLPVWTTADGAQRLTLRYVPLAAFPSRDEVPRIAHVRLLSYDPAALPVRVQSWIPYRTLVTSPAPAWLETPRMYQVGYRATVQGRPALVRKSPDGFVCVAVPEGASSVELSYVAPAGLSILFWLSLLSMAAVAGCGAWAWILHLHRARCPAKASAAASAHGM